MDTNSKRHTLAAILIGMIIPAGAFGVGAVSVTFALALVAALTVPNRKALAQRVLLQAAFHPVGILCTLMLCLWLPNLIISPTPQESCLTWLRVLVLLLGGTFLWSLLDRNQVLTQKTLQTVFYATTAILALTVFLIFLFPEVIHILRNTSMNNTWLRYKSYATVLACVLPLCLFFKAETTQKKLCVGLLFALSLVVIFKTGNRSAIAGLGIASIAIIFLTALKHPKLRIPLAMVVVAGLIAISFYLKSFYDLGDQDQFGALGWPRWAVDIHRQHIWLFVLQHIPDTPVFGHGLNAIAHIPGAHDIIPGIGQQYIPSHPHNWVLEVLSETGIFGLLPLLTILSLFLINDIRAFYRHDSKRHAARLCLNIVFWTTTAFSFSLWAPWWGMIYVFLMAMVSARLEMSESPQPKMLFSVTEGFAFMSHRLPMARAAKACGYDVGVICAPGDKITDIESHGIFVHPWTIDRAGTNPIKEWRTLNALRKAYETEQPALVHHVAVKPVLYGAIAAQMANVPMIVNAMIGLGFLFINKGQKASILRKVVLTLLKLTLDRPNSRLLVQNPDDAELFANSGIIAKDRIVLIPGSGVDASKYAPQPEPDTQTIVVSVVSRMLWDKGIGETVEAARLLKNRGLNVRIRLVGDVDTANPQCIPRETLQSWHAEGVVEWTGPRHDIQNVWTESHIALLPSYREGMPKALLEAAACARPLITTDAPGCRSLVEEGQNGLLVPLKDGPAIAAAIEQLATNPQLRQTMGANARQRVETIYADPVIEKSVSALYDSLKSNEAQA